MTLWSYICVHFCFCFVDDISLKLCKWRWVQYKPTIIISGTCEIFEWSGSNSTKQDIQSENVKFLKHYTLVP